MSRYLEDAAESLRGVGIHRSGGAPADRADVHAIARCMSLVLDYLRGSRRPPPPASPPKVETGDGEKESGPEKTRSRDPRGESHSLAPLQVNESLAQNPPGGLGLSVEEWEALDVVVGESPIVGLHGDRARRALRKLKARGGSEGAKAIDPRPKCIECGRRWVPAEGEDATDTPCDECKVSDASEAGAGAAYLIEPPPREQGGGDSGRVTISSSEEDDAAGGRRIYEHKHRVTGSKPDAFYWMALSPNERASWVDAYRFVRAESEQRLKNEGAFLRAKEREIRAQTEAHLQERLATLTREKEAAEESLAASRSLVTILEQNEKDLRAGVERERALKEAAEARVVAVEKERDEILEAVWNHTDLDPEHQISSHADTLPLAYRQACAALDKAKEIGSRRLLADELRPQSPESAK